MKYLKNFVESVENSDIDDILDILQYFGDTKPIIWQNHLVRYTKGMFVVYFNESNEIDLDDIKECHQRLDRLNYELISSEYQDGKLWFLILSKDLLKKYVSSGFKFIEDLNPDADNNYWYHISNDSIVIKTERKNNKIVYWTVFDSISDNEEATNCKILANIYFLEAQHRIKGVHNYLSNLYK